MSDNPHRYEPGFTIEQHRDELIDRLGEAIRRIAALTAERDSAKQELAEIEANATAERKKYEVLEAENAALKKALSKPWEHSEHWRNPETGHIECECCCKWALDMESLKKENAALKAQVERLSAPVSDEEWLDDLCAGDHVQFADLQRHEVDRFIAARTTPPAKEPK